MVEALDAEKGVLGGEKPVERPPSGTAGRISRGLGLLAFVVAVGALIGWHYDIEPLRRTIPRSVPMSPTVAACIALLGASLAINTRVTFGIWVRRACCALVLAIGTIKLFDIVTGTQSGIDQHLLATKIDATDPFYGNPMAPTAAFNLVAISIASVLGDRRGVLRDRFVRCLAGLAILIALVAITGYLLGVQRLYDPVGVYPMALNTASATLILAIAAALRTANAR
jgi:hypothetical protein